jgi:transcriptional regulator with XRE-family HTH domain
MPRYGNGTTPDINVFIGKKIRRRRRLLGLTQQQLAGTVGVRFQQVQKYECGANKVSAEHLWQISEALEVPVGYFYEGYSGATSPEPLAPEDTDLLQAKETRQLVKAYYALGEVPRRRLLQLAESLHEEA